MSDDNNMKTAAPICRAQNPELDVVKRFLFAMPNLVMPKKEYDKVTEARFNGWTSTHYQMAKQMALYYTKDDICYPRFKNDVSTEEIVRYMSRWAKMYYAPNPFTKDLNKYDNVEPTVLYSYFCQCITDGMTSYNDACERLFGDIHLNNVDKVKLMLNSFTDIYIEQNGQMSFQKWASHKVPDLHPSIDNPLDEESFFNYFNIDSNIYTFDRDKSISYTAQTIYYGPPGTGKTYEMQKIFAGYPEGNRSVITFHQSYSYEEFIIGLKAKTTEDNKIEYSYEKGVFYNACERAAVLAGYSSLAECCSDTNESRNAKFAAAAGDKSRQFLFCIDEINRANISAVFGDLISLIEENKRLGAQNEMIVRLPYTQELFGVPANLRLLGTMNTADRSIQILDTALRRRFQFKEYLPDYDVLRNEKAKTILQAINDRIRALLGQDRQIGHSYFYDIEASAADESIRILKALANKIIPLLQEYFYNDVEKIRFVLGEKDRIPDEHSFYIEDGDATAAFSRYDSDNEETSFYILNTEGIASASMSNESASAFIDHITA